MTFNEMLEAIQPTLKAAAKYHGSRSRRIQRNLDDYIQETNLYLIQKCSDRSFTEKNLAQYAKKVLRSKIFDHCRADIQATDRIECTINDEIHSLEDRAIYREFVPLPDKYYVGLTPVQQEVLSFWCNTNASPTMFVESRERGLKREVLYGRLVRALKRVKERIHNV